MTSKTAADVRTLLERSIRAATAPGAVAGWWSWETDDPEVVTVGRASVGTESEHLSPNHHFDLASLTKPLVVTPLVCLLVRNDALSLETTVGEVFPELAEREIGRRRVRHLLIHTSGLPAWEPLYARADSAEAGEVIRAIGEIEVGEVGREVVYSCPGFILLSLLIERLTSTPLDLLLARLVLEPLGLDSELGYRPEGGVQVASGSLDPTVERELLIERDLDPQTVPAVGHGLADDGNTRFRGGVSGNAGLFGTIRGVMELSRALSVPGELLTDTEISGATRNHTPGLGQARGLAWQLASSPDCSAGPALDSSAFGHTGFTGTSVWVDPVKRVVLALLTNRNHPGQRLNDLHPLRRRFHQLVVDSL